VHPLNCPSNQLLTLEQFAATRPTILMFHGNGGNVGHRVPLGKVFYTKMRCNVVMAEYRGYGNSDGSPSEKGEYLSAVLYHSLMSEFRNPYGRSSTPRLHHESPCTWEDSCCEFVQLPWYRTLPTHQSIK
jgi:fermentation-respiration switch protein FrsA (DUF1100 family)